MPVNVNQQTIVFFACILTGMVSGIICDILGITAKKLRFNKSAFFVQDIIIWFIILAFFFTVIYKINGAVLRWYVFLGAVLLSNTVVFPIALGIVTVICLFEMFKCMGLEKKLYLTVPLYLFGAPS